MTLSESWAGYESASDEHTCNWVLRVEDIQALHEVVDGGGLCAAAVEVVANRVWSDLYRISDAVESAAVRGTKLAVEAGCIPVTDRRVGRCDGVC